MYSTEYSIEETKLRNLNTFSAILLGVFTVTAFVANIFLLTTIASSYQLRNTIFYYHVLHIACINLLYTAINSLISMLYVSTGEWRFGTFACSLNAFVGELMAIETMYGVTLMSVDRAIALLSISKYETRLTTLRTAVAVLGCWVVGIVIALPVLVDSIPSEPYPARFFCAVSRNPIGYPIATLIVCYVFPMLVVLWSIGLILFRMHKDRLRRRAMLPERFGDYTDFIVDNRRVQRHMELAKFSVITFIVYYLLQGPYYTFKFITQIRNSVPFRDDLSGQNPTDIPPDAETTITLLYSLFLVVFPLLTFCYAKDVWKKFQDLVCCRKTNVISTTVVSSASTIAGGTYGRRTMEEVQTGNVVTILPTSDGIHQIRPGRDEPEYADVPRRHGGYDEWHVGQRNKTRSTEMNDGTSDYDSEDSDTFEEANPDNLYNSETSAQIYKTELVDGAMRKTRQDIDFTRQPASSTIMSAPQPQNLSASQSEIQLQSAKDKLDMIIDDAAQQHKRSKSESETKLQSTADNSVVAKKRKSLDNSSIGDSKDKTSAVKSTLRQLTPGAVPSPVSAVRSRRSASHGRLPPLASGAGDVPNIPRPKSGSKNLDPKSPTVNRGGASSVNSERTVIEKNEMKKRKSSAQK